MSARLLPLLILSSGPWAWAQPLVPVSKFEKGRIDKFSLVQEVKQSLVAKAGAEPSKQSIKSTLEGSFKTVDVSGDGATVEMTFTRIRLEVSVGGRDYAFDSETDRGLGEKPLAAGGSPLTGAVFTLTFDKTGKLAEVAGFEAVFEKLAKHPNFMGAVTALRQAIGDAPLKAALHPVLGGRRPSGPVPLAGTWAGEELFPLGAFGELKFNCRYIYAGLASTAGSSAAKVTFTGMGAFTAPAAAGNGPTVKSTSADIKGSFRSDADTGRTLECESTLTFKGTIDFTADRSGAFEQVFTVNYQLNPKTSGTGSGPGT